ncbi:hypothetical protein GCM10009743_65390 [Kribbella swartbergensis]
MRLNQGRPPDEPMSVRLGAQHLCIKNVRPIGDGGYGSSPVPYLRSDELGTHIARLSMERIFVKPHDFQILGEVPHLVGVAKLGRQAVCGIFRCEP